MSTSDFVMRETLLCLGNLVRYSSSVEFDSSLFALHFFAVLTECQISASYTPQGMEGNYHKVIR